MSSKSKLFFLVGNFGVGKSSIIKEPELGRCGLLIGIRQNLWVLGTHICGADSLRGYKKTDVRASVVLNKDKNIIIAGVFYCAIIDVVIFSEFFDVVVIYLKTSFAKNAKRMANRDGAPISISMYNSRLKNQLSMIKKVKNIAKVYIIDNDKDLIETKKEFFNIVSNETNRPNTD